jgi:hypothetical protein
MTVLQETRSWWTSNIFTFVREFEVHDKFEAVTGKKLEDWDYEDADAEVIAEILNLMDGVWFFTYDESHDGFNIYRMEDDIEGYTKNLGA